MDDGAYGQKLCRAQVDHLTPSPSLRSYTPDIGETLVDRVVIIPLHCEDQMWANEVFIHLPEGKAVSYSKLPFNNLQELDAWYTVHDALYGGADVGHLTVKKERFHDAHPLIQVKSMHCTVT